MPTDLQYYETDDATLATAFDFGQLAPKETSAVKTLHLWNGKSDASADTAKGVVATAYERQVVTDPDTGDVTSVTAWNQEGRATIERYIEARVTDQDGNVSPWTPVGKGRWLALPEIAAGEKVVVEWRMVMPGNPLSTAEREFRAVTDWDSFATPTDLGHHEAGGRGVLSGSGDGAESHLISGYDLTVSDPVDADFNVSEGVAIVAGGAYPDVAHAVTTSANDGDGVALGASEEYWITVSKGAQAGLTLTKSAKGASPLADSARPAVPTGEELVGYARRTDAGVTEVFQGDRLFGRFLLETSGLNFELHPGGAALDNRIIRRTGKLTGTLPASDTSLIWLDALTGGTFVTADGAADPAERAMKLWRVTTDGSAETAREDLRLYTGAQHRITMRAEFEDALAVDDARHFYIPPGRGLRVRVPNGIGAALVDQGSGNTAGNTKWDVEYSEAGGAWTTIFTSSATTDRRPTIAFDAADPSDADAFPEVLDIPGNSRVRIRVVEVPTGGASAPSGGVVDLNLEEL